MVDRAREVAVRRFERFAREVLAPAVFVDPRPLDVEVFQTEERIAFDAACEAAYRPVEIGWRWGPVWSTAWFRLRLPAVTERDGMVPVLRFSSGTEALLWCDGIPVRGLDANRDAVDRVRLPSGNAEAVVHVEAACNHAFGISTFEWDVEEVHRRWRDDRPGRLERAELAWRRPEVESLHVAFLFAVDLLREVDDPSVAVSLQALLEEVVSGVDENDPSTSAPTWVERIRVGLGEAGPPLATTCHAIGHAHIDTAWLWPMAETRRKCMRTFSNALELLDEHADFRFLASQAQQYAWVEEASPELFDRVRRAIADGRFQPVGAMWVEPDCNIPSAESLVRQILYGAAWFRDRFEERGESRVAYLPDTFGFTAALPTILKHAGIDTFVTNKLNWNTENEFPYTTFHWSGVDGSRVLAHLTPGGDYNATNTATELLRGARGHRGVSPPHRYLQPFGFGDGGGGPTPAHIERARLAASAAALPRVEQTGIERFRERIHQDVDLRAGRGDETPEWMGELYLEIHRGTLTTMGQIKRGNRRLEELLRQAELLWAASGDLDRPAEVQAELDDAWREVLCRQFHDILPGTSIRVVHEEAVATYERLERSIGERLDEALLERVAALESNAGDVVFNPTSHPRGGVVLGAGRPRVVGSVPAFGLATSGSSQPPHPVRVSERRIGNGILEVSIDDAGRVASLIHVASGRNLATKAPLNQLVLYRDRPHTWDAWDIDPGYERHAEPVDGPAEVVSTSLDPLVGEIVVRRPLGRASSIVQTYRLLAGSPRLDVMTRVDWREEHRLLRALFPTPLRVDQATCGIQIGHVLRPTHRNTSFERARFEFCAHGSVDLSEPGCGFALLTDAKYGHSLRGGEVGVSLLRAPRTPDPKSDVGEHEFTYALMPHAGDWRAAGVDREAESLGAPLRVVEAPERRVGGPTTWAPFRVEVVEGAAEVMIDAFKPPHGESADRDARILRFHERRGGRGRVRIEWSSAMGSVVATDGRERPVERTGLRHDGTTTELDIAPFELITLAATPAN